MSPNPISRNSGAERSVRFVDSDDCANDVDARPMHVQSKTTICVSADNFIAS